MRAELTDLALNPASVSQQLWNLRQVMEPVISLEKKGELRLLSYLPLKVRMSKEADGEALYRQIIIHVSRISGVVTGSK